MSKKAFQRLVKGEPISMDERLENLEKITELKLKQFEDTLLLFRDVVMKLYEEKEELRKENESLSAKVMGSVNEAKESVIDAGKFVTAPIRETADDFLEIMAEEPELEPEEPEEPKTALPPEAKASHISPDILKQSDEMERTTKWMREKFGLPPTHLRKKKKKVRA